MGLSYIWHSHAQSNVNKVCKIIRERCKDVERQNLFSNISEKISFVYYCKIKQNLGMH
jgi:hypothetical protein